MTIQSILRKKGRAVEMISPHATAKDAIEVMREKNISALVVADGEAIRGLVSERDILQALSERAKAPAALPVGDALSRRMITVGVGDTLRHAMNLMTGHRIRHLPVISDGVMVGIVSTGDLIKDRLEDLEIETNVLRDVYIAAR